MLLWGKSNSFDRVITRLLKLLDVSGTDALLLQFHDRSGPIELLHNRVFTLNLFDLFLYDLLLLGLAFLLSLHF